MQCMCALLVFINVSHNNNKKPKQKNLIAFAAVISRWSLHWHNRQCLLFSFDYGFFLCSLLLFFNKENWKRKRRKRHWNVIIVWYCLLIWFSFFSFRYIIIVVAFSISIDFNDNWDLIVFYKKKLFPLTAVQLFDFPLLISFP